MDTDEYVSWVGQIFTDLDFEVMIGLFILGIQQSHAPVGWILEESVRLKM